MSGGLVFMNDVFVGNPINDAGCFAEDVFCSSFVTGVNCLANAFDRGAKHGSHASIVLIAGDRLTGAFTSLGGIGHFFELLPVT